MPRFRGPEEMTAKSRKLPVSARVGSPTLKILKDTARRHKIPLATLIENVLNDYALWLIERKRS